MGTSALVSVQEYLNSSYSPDREFIEGHLLERNVGEKQHSKMQRVLIRCLSKYEQEGLEVWPEQRVQVRPDRFRVPDICLTEGEPDEEIFSTPPLICIEILSPKDTLRSTHEKIQDYLLFGVPYVWALIPRGKEAYIGTASGYTQVTSGVLVTLPPHPRVAIDLAEVFRR
jgi:Uma2 family endonuclease